VIDFWIGIHINKINSSINHIYKKMAMENGNSTNNKDLSLLMPHDLIDHKDFEPSTGVPIEVKTYPGGLTTRSLPCKVILDKTAQKQYGPT
jgi:hypothetical protein